MAYDEIEPSNSGTEPVYEDVEDRAEQEALQNNAKGPDVIFDRDALDRLLLMIENSRDEELPDQVILANWPQVPENELFEPVLEVIARTEGPKRDTRDVEIESGDDTVLFRRTESTRFVRVILADGTEAMERYDPTRHGPWGDIPDTGMTPTQLLEDLYGFGDTGVEQGQQFQRVRKSSGGASKTNWPARRHPRVKRT